MYSLHRLGAAVADAARTTMRDDLRQLAHAAQRAAVDTGSIVIIPTGVGSPAAAREYLPGVGSPAALHALELRVPQRQRQRRAGVAKPLRREAGSTPDVPIVDVNPKRKIRL